jgi:hypothetical protein
MSRASLVYVAMFLVLIAGLWAILRVGSLLAAPADLQGEWTVDWSDDAPPDLPPKLSIQQSGVFAHARLGDHPPLSGRLNKVRGATRVSGDLASRDGRWRLTFDPYAGGDLLTGMLDAPTHASFTASRAAARSKPTAAAASKKPGTPHARQ